MRIKDWFIHVTIFTSFVYRVIAALEFHYPSSASYIILSYRLNSRYVCTAVGKLAWFPKISPNLLN